MLIFTLSFFNVGMRVLLQMPEVTTKFILRSTNFTLLLLNFYNYQTKTITGVDLTSVNYNFLTYNIASIAIRHSGVRRFKEYRQTVSAHIILLSAHHIKTLRLFKLNVLLIYIYYIYNRKIQVTDYHSSLYWESCRGGLILKLKCNPKEKRN